LVSENISARNSSAHQKNDRIACSDRSRVMIYRNENDGRILREHNVFELILDAIALEVATFAKYQRRTEQ
jgi:hypothetical protein